MLESKESPLVSPLISEKSTIYAHILNDIANAVFHSGDRLISTKLAEKYQTSINPVREALKQLQGEGFVTVEPNSGARVALFEYNTLRDVFEILQLLEPYLMTWFVEEHTDEDRLEMERLLNEMETASDKEYRSLDTQFHWLTVKNHYNQKAVDLWRRNRLILLAMQSNVRLNTTRIKQSIEEHKRIIRGLENRDVKTVLDIMNEHIGNSGQYWTKYLQRNNMR
ncbi:GntR family transcriptional regulator [Paraglaciecola agarilytica]|uniref:GntR family transcriptional regulator n=1 Tax=Paraglaciecola chathamensis TaxID=368405 RepID=UPI001C08AF73|nr:MULTISPECIES: GntR family transcriptional regulator [Paraglaciecola]MBU3018837.1 GntR family transcriptional regulator [Paraglaciecola agarilytica]MDO6840185.1 GntR family transcriptional regulator [Paraglaciecola chathamensis]